MYFIYFWHLKAFLKVLACSPSSILYFFLKEISYNLLCIFNQYLFRRKYFEHLLFILLWKTLGKQVTLVQSFCSKFLSSIGGGSPARGAQDTDKKIMESMGCGKFLNKDIKKIFRKHRGALNSALRCLAEGSGTTSLNAATQLSRFCLRWPVYSPLHKCWKDSHPSASVALK